MLAHPQLVAVDRAQRLCAQINNMRHNEWRRYYELTNFSTQIPVGDRQLLAPRADSMLWQVR